MRALVHAAVFMLIAVPREGYAQNEGALRAALEGKIITLKIDMPATSRGVDVYPEDAAPINFRELAQRIKDNGTAIRIGQQLMVTKVVVKGDSHIEFQLGGGGYGTFGDLVGDGSNVSHVSAGETREEKVLRDSIKKATGPTRRKQLERELASLRSERERENSRAAAEAQQAQEAREANLRLKRLDAGSRFNIRYRNGIPAGALTPEGVLRALAQWAEMPGAPSHVATVTGAGPATSQLLSPSGSASPGALASLRRGLLLKEVETLLGPAATATESREGALTVLKRTYKHDGMKISASFVNEVMIDFSITPQ